MKPASVPLPVRSRNGSMMVWLLLILGAFVMVLPFAWLVNTSFKKPDELFKVFPRRPSPASLANYILPKRQYAEVGKVWYEGEVQQTIPGTVLVEILEGKEMGSVYQVGTEKLDGNLVVVPEADIATFVKCRVLETVLPVRRVVELYATNVVDNDVVIVDEAHYREQYGISWRNYAKVFTSFDFFRYLVNTVFVVILSIVGVVLSSTLSAYAFARLEFPGRDTLFMVLISSMMLPGIVLMIPNFHIWKYLGALDTYWPLVFPYFLGSAATAFYIFMLRQFFRGIPAELADAARIDGCSEFGIYWRIILPLSKPALAAVAIFVFMGVWNDFMRPLIYLFTPEKSTLALGLATFKSTYAGGGSYAVTATGKWNLLMAASTIMVVPVIAIFFMAQRYFVKGVTLTGLKG